MTSSHLLSWRETDSGPPVAKRHRCGRGEPTVYGNREENDSDNNNNSNQENDDAESRYPQMTVSDTSGSSPPAQAPDQPLAPPPPLSSQPALFDQVFDADARSPSLSPPPPASSLSHLPVLSPLLANTTTDFLFDSSSSRSSSSPHLTVGGTDPDASLDSNQRECSFNQVVDSISDWDQLLKQEFFFYIR